MFRPFTFNMFLFVMLLLMLRANNQKHVFCYAKAKRIGNKFQGI